MFTNALLDLASSPNEADRMSVSLSNNTFSAEKHVTKDGIKPPAVNTSPAVNHEPSGRSLGVSCIFLDESDSICLLLYTDSALRLNLDVVEPQVDWQKET